MSKMHHFVSCGAVSICALRTPRWKARKAAELPRRLRVQTLLGPPKTGRSQRRLMVHSSKGSSACELYDSHPPSHDGFRQSRYGRIATISRSSSRWCRLNGWQSKAFGLGCSVYDRIPTSTLSLTLRIDCNTVDEICICFWPSDHKKIDPSGGLYDCDATRDDFRGKVGQPSWCGLASYAWDIFDESGHGRSRQPERRHLL